MSKKNSKTMRWSEAELNVLVDLFAQLPTLHLAFCVRGASIEWRNLVDNSERLSHSLRRRARCLEEQAQEKRQTDPFYDLEAIDRAHVVSRHADRAENAENASINDDLWRCVVVLSAALLQWDCEAVLRRYRQATLQPLAAMAYFWENSPTVDDVHNGLPYPRTVAEEILKSHQELQMRVLHDSNDRSAEQHVFRIQGDQRDNEDP